MALLFSKPAKREHAIKPITSGRRPHIHDRSALDFASRVPTTVDVPEISSSSGQRLPGPVEDRAIASFDESMRDVRVHTDGSANRAAERIHARESDDSGGDIRLSEKAFSNWRERDGLIEVSGKTWTALTHAYYNPDEAVREREQFAERRNL